MTLQQLLDSVNGNLGDRAGGTIGSQPTDTVILQGVNFALPQCVKLADPSYYTGTLSLSVPAGSSTEIAVPTVNIGTSAHNVKDIVHHRTSRSADGTSLTIIKKTWAEFLQVTTDYDQQHTGVPSFMAFREGNMYLNRVPEEDYTFTLFVELWPNLLSTTSLETDLPINTQWELALEAFTTYYCYLKLQQMPLAQYWKELYEDQKDVNKQQDRKTDVRGSGMGGIVTVSGNPQLDPFVRSWN